MSDSTPLLFSPFFKAFSTLSLKRQSSLFFECMSGQIVPFIKNKKKIPFSSPFSPTIGQLLRCNSTTWPTSPTTPLASCHRLYKRVCDVSEREKAREAFQARTGTCCKGAPSLGRYLEPQLTPTGAAGPHQGAVKRLLVPLSLRCCSCPAKVLRNFRLHHPCRSAATPPPPVRLLCRRYAPRVVFFLLC